MVPHRPFFSGSPGCVRSNAWIWLFSSKHSTSALSGGFKYSPTTSVSFSRNFASRESLKMWLRCGLRLGSCPKRFRSAQHQCLVGWVQIQPHHIGQLLQEFRIPRELKDVAQVRLEVVQLP